MFTWNETLDFEQQFLIPKKSCLSCKVWWGKVETKMPLLLCLVWSVKLEKGLNSILVCSAGSGSVNAT